MDRKAMNIARNSIIIFTAKILLSSCTFATMLVVARVLGPKGLGVYALFLAVVGLAVNVGSFGLGSTSLYLLNREKKDINKLFSNVLIFGFIWGILIAGFLVLLSSFFPYIFSLPTIYIVAGFVIIPLHLLIMYLLPFFTAFFEVMWWSFFSVLYPLFVFLSTLVAIFFFGLGVSGAILAVAVSSMVTFLLLFVVLWNKYHLRFQPHLPTLKEQLHFGLRSYVGELFNTIDFKMNTLMVSFFVPIVPIGYFSAALTMISILYFLPFSFQLVLGPFWSSRTLQELNHNTPKVARQAFMVAIGGSLLVFLFSKQFTLLLFGEGFETALSSFLMLLPGFIAFAFASILFTSFFARGKPQLTSSILLGTLLLNGVLNILLIPHMGIEGAALSISISLVGALLFALGTFVRITKVSLRELLMFKFDDVRSLWRQFQSIR